MWTRDEEITYRLVTSEDANVNAGLDFDDVAHRQEPPEQEGRREVEVKIPAGTRTFEVLRFTTMHDQKG